MDSDNFILKNSFKDLDEYIKKLEKYAIIGMTSEISSHGFNSGAANLRHQIDKLPKEYDSLKDLYAKTMGLVHGVMENNYISQYRDTLKHDFFKKEFKDVTSNLTIDKDVDFFVPKALFQAILYELINNAKRYSSNREEEIEVKISKNMIQIVNYGPVPKRPTEIFNLGYSEKRGGSNGFGLYICKRLLNEMDLDLSYHNSSENRNLFVIRPKR